MASVTNIVLADAQATPVNHTFNPVAQGNNGEWIFEDQSSGTPLFYPRITISVSRPMTAPVGSNSAGRVARVPVSIAVPVSDGAVVPSIAYIARFKGEFILPEAASLQVKKDLKKYVTGLMTDGQLSAAVENFSAPY